MAGRLNDQEVATEMNKMVCGDRGFPGFKCLSSGEVQFIKQEALEKAREIKVKADEEFNIEKAKIVRQETVAIDTFFEKKKKQAETQRKIAQSNHINKNRLRVLQARQQVFQDLLAEARTHLVKISQDKEKYHALLKDLILQALYQLMEKTVVIQCRKPDIEAVRAAATSAKETYLKEFPKGGGLEFSIDESNWLPDTSAGGVVVQSTDNRIRVSNTLEARLELLSEQMLPDIRIMLFGPSPNRRFFN
ncbi:V-ATPase V1 sector subunit E [Borealophlyctis nickersoniae]|nr:V-ATPase V1 sector subunit E [Borealophlyctis nickersoniae]